MKFSSISTVRSSASALILAGTVFFGVSGIAYAQYGGDTSRQGSSAKEKPGDYSDKEGTIKGSTGKSSTEKSGSTKPGAKDKYYGMPKEKEEMDTGYADQKKKAERAQDPRSPSPDPHVSDFPRDKEGKPLKDLKDEQGGSIGPN